MSAPSRSRPQPGGRKRTRDADSDAPNPSNAPPSSPPASSPPVFPQQNDIDDGDDDILDPEEEVALDIDDADEMAEDDAGIDLFGDNFENDYSRREDDRYAGRDIDDDGDYDQMDLAQRRQLEARLNRRDREVAREARMPRAFLQDEEDDVMDLTRQPRR
ncbi:MCM DNA helicase complex subunit [Oleoguttula sp. CCFEE 5521]